MRPAGWFRLQSSNHKHRGGPVVNDAPPLMKRCPKCRRDYTDDTLLYCLDDGESLLDGPGNKRVEVSERPTAIFEPSTQLLRDEAIEAENPKPASRRITWIVAASILALAGITGLAFMFVRPVPEPALQIKSLAVLPLDNLSNDASQEFFADGMTEALIGSLSQVGSIKVISRTSVMRYKKSGKSIPEIAKELSVDGIIEGSIQRSDGRVRVTAQLVHAATDSPVWSRSFERSMTDILKLQSEIAQAVVSEIRAQLTPAERQRLEGSSTIDPAATEAFLLGRHYFHKWTRESERQAVDQFQKAVAIEPEYADAWAGLADAWTVRAMVGDITASEAEKPTRAATLRALEIDPNNAAAHISMCFVRNNYDFDWAAGEASCKRGIELDPNNAKGHFAYAYLLSRSGRHSEIDAHMRNAMRLDPAEAWWPSVYGSMLIQAGRFEEAEKQIMRAIEVDPTYNPSFYALGDLYTEQGRFDDAIKAREKAGAGPTSLKVAYIHARSGDKEKARQILSKTESRDPYSQALVYTALDDFDKAFEVIERTLNEGNSFMFGFANFRELDRLKRDPRWEPIRRRMNLPE